MCGIIDCSYIVSFLQEKRERERIRKEKQNRERKRERETSRFGVSKHDWVCFKKNILDPQKKKINKKEEKKRKKEKEKGK